MDNYFLAWHDSAKKTGGVKAKEDTEKTLEGRGYKRIETPRNKVAKLIFVYLILPTIFSKIKNSTIFLQYPSGTPRMMKKIIKSVKKNRTNNLIMLVHDVEALRLHSGSEFSKENQRELEMLNSANGLIVLNEKMRKWLIKSGINVTMVNLEVWDYRNEIPYKKDWIFDNTICFAGNLRKSTFLKKLELSHEVYLYGIKSEKTIFSDNIKYMGSFSPEILPNYLKQNWGLVWDGTSIDTCTGKYGSYLKFNNPHKISLYLSSGIPVIVWKKSAIAAFIEKTKTGILIDSLTDLDNVLNQVTETEYRKIRDNVQIIGNNVRDGYYLNTALDSLYQLLDKRRNYEK